MTEVVGFCQEDLDEDDVMLLDTWEEVSTDSPSLSAQTYFQTGYGLICFNPSFNVKPRAVCLLSQLQTLHGAWSDKQVYVQSCSPGTKHVSEGVLLSLFQKGGNRGTWSMPCFKAR